MIGASGPSISIMTLSMFSPENAARRCSTVETEANRGVAQHGAELGLRNIRPFRLDEALAAVGEAGAEENDAGIGVGGGAE